MLCVYLYLEEYLKCSNLTIICLKLGEIGKKYSGFITSNANQGINMSYKLQKLLKKESQNVARGFTLVQQQTTLDENAGYNKVFLDLYFQDTFV